MMHSAARDLQGCMANLMWFEEEDLLEILLLKSMDDMPIASPMPAEEAALLEEPEESQVTAMHPLTYEEQALKPEDVAGLGETATEPQAM